MNTLLILLIGYCAGRSDHFHAKARECLKSFKEGYKKKGQNHGK